MSSVILFIKRYGLERLICLLCTACLLGTQRFWYFSLSLLLHHLHLVISLKTLLKKKAAKLERWPNKNIYKHGNKLLKATLKIDNKHSLAWNQSRERSFHVCLCAVACKRNSFGDLFHACLHLTIKKRGTKQGSDFSPLGLFGRFKARSAKHGIDSAWPTSAASILEVAVVSPTATRWPPTCHARARAWVRCTCTTCVAGPMGVRATIP